MTYIKSLKEKNWLLPLPIQEMIPKDHICFLREDYVDSLDFSHFNLIFDKHDVAQFQPQIENIKENIELPKEVKVGFDSGLIKILNITYVF